MAVTERREVVAHDGGRVLDIARWWWWTGTMVDRGGWRGAPMATVLWRTGAGGHRRSALYVEDGGRQWRYVEDRHRLCGVGVGGAGQGAGAW
jgi:hypothetical protein